jgi:hypothetical protein
MATSTTMYICALREEIKQGGNIKIEVTPEQGRSGADQKRHSVEGHADRRIDRHLGSVKAVA